MASHAEDAAQIDRDGGVIADLLCEWQEPAADRTEKQRDVLHRAIDALDDASRGLMQMLLEGMTQVALAESLGVCEGTVSRRRIVIIERLTREVAGRSRLPR